MIKVAQIMGLVGSIGGSTNKSYCSHNQGPKNF